MEPRIQKELEMIKEGVLKTVPTEEIYLFGSYAYGAPHKDSDLDIYVVVPDMDIDLLDARAAIRGALSKRSMPLDLLIGKASVFNRRKQGPTLERIIAREGVRIYG